MATEDDVWGTFRDLEKRANQKFASVQDLPAFGRAQGQYFHKVFKAHMRLWKFQQENRSKLVESGLKRWQIGDIASRIGQLYFGQYMRTSEARFLLEAYIFYEAILKRRYFEEAHGNVLRVRFKELRFYARFLLVSLIVGRREMFKHLSEKLRVLVDDSQSNFQETNFKEWKLIVQEINRFMKADTDLTHVRPLRYCTMLDSLPASQPYLAKFHPKKLVKFREAVLTSYHRNEVKFAEVTLDTYRMLQCLEWEPSGSFYKKQSIESKENGVVIDHSAPSGLIDLNLAADMADPSLPPNPRKTVLYRPSVSHLLAVLAMICDELPPESVMLIYISAAGGSVRSNFSESESSAGSSKSKSKLLSRASHEQKGSKVESHSNGESCRGGDFYDSNIWLGPKGGGSGSNNLYPGDIIPFTRKPLFLIIDSDNSRAFKVLHGAERGEPAALLLSPLKPSFKNPSAAADSTSNGNQFTFYLTAPLQAFCQMLDLSYPNTDPEVYEEAENIISIGFSEWEVILSTSKILNLVWAQVLSDPFLRRIILRFIFCRSVLDALCRLDDDHDGYLPVCIPDLPDFASSRSDVVKAVVRRLAKHFGVTKCFSF